MPKKPTKSAKNNLFCQLSDLDNEASVEQFFVSRMLADLGYADRQIKPKTSLERIKVSAGRKKVYYVPDYAMVLQRKPRWICDAKATGEDLDNWVGQGGSYCLELNKKYSGENPVEYFVLSNGVETRVYRWDSGTPELVLPFDHFQTGHPQYEKMRALLAPGAFKKAATKPTSGVITLAKKSANELNADFAWCHNQIHKKGDLSYTAAFMEFVKLVFLKLLSDREIHRRYPAFSDPKVKTIQVDASEVKFSVAWINTAESLGTENPIDRIQFSSLVRDLEVEIRAGRKKRIFAPDERIQLPAGVIRDVAERLQSTDLFGIDADLNGRLFETFLNATLRGRSLGQYFTPRSVVKLATALADLRVSSDLDKCDRVMDACCGTGGFLIEALADMWTRVDGIKSLSAASRSSLKDDIATNCIFGIDSAKDPALARIARINMYLHGDGGSRIYQFDSLDKKTSPRSDDTAELKEEKREFLALLASSPEGLADVVLTNPPFAKEYERAKAGTVAASEQRILDDYELAFSGAGHKRKPKKKMRSSIMFLERYEGLLKPGGRLITVLDDSVLSSAAYGPDREWILRSFVVEAVISLPGDAFQRSEARVKTSLLLLRKKADPGESQPDVFMYYCTAVGVDDPPRARVLPIDEINRSKATEEVRTVARLLKAFRDGTPDAADWVVPADALGDRWDVKACLLSVGRRIDDWKDAGKTVVRVDALVENRFDDVPEGHPDIITSDDTGELIQMMRVRYDGFAEQGEEVFAEDVKYAFLYRVHAGDIVVSHINAIHGAVAVVPPELDGLAASPEYSVLRTKDGVDARVVWALLRTPEARSDLLLGSKGIGRTRIDWSQLAAVQVPFPSAVEVAALVQRFDEVERIEQQARAVRQGILQSVNAVGDLDNDDARAILAAFKPPR